MAVLTGEWNSACTPTALVHDQYYKASFMLDEIRRAAGNVDSMSYWTFTDIFRRVGLGTWGEVLAAGADEGE